MTNKTSKVLEYDKIIERHRFISVFFVTCSIPKAFSVFFVIPK